jgi:glycosyltransferase involved in cell wall biosynthesis
MKPKISIIVPTRDNRFICQVKEDLSKQTFKDFELIVMDSNGPVSMKRNKGVKQAKGEWIVFIDDDVRLPPDWLKQLLQNSDKDIIVTGSVMTIYPFGLLTHSTSCNCIFHKSKFVPFDESFKYAAHEDKDWFFRMDGTKVVPTAVIYHMDQQKCSMKKNFIFGMESVKLHKRWGERHQISRVAYYGVRNAFIDIAGTIGVAYGILKYRVFGCR